MVAAIEEGGERNIGVIIICSHYVKMHLHLIPACAVGGQPRRLEDRGGQAGRRTGKEGVEEPPSNPAYDTMVTTRS
jgi:hypothetical protein